MINCDQQQMEMLADKIILDIKQDPFSCANGISIGNYTEEEFEVFEDILLSKMPNLVIRHSDSDTSEDLSNQLKRVKDILLDGMQPYFIDFATSKNKVKTKDN